MKITNAILTFVCLLLLYASLVHAQQTGRLNAPAIPDAKITYVSSTAAPTLAIVAEPPAANPRPADPPQTGSAVGGTAQDDKWHLSVSPYLWFPWAHGTVGAFGRDASFSVTPSDLLSHARFGLLGAVEAQRNRLLTTIDLLYMRLGDDKALPFPGVRATSANLTANMFILTPKIVLRLINEKKIKADFLTGIRYWYFGENLNFSPSRAGLNFSKSQNWVDPLVGGRIEGALSPKLGATLAGDVGGWGTGSQLEYQVVGVLGYKIKPNMTFQAGYRYLYFDYQKGGPAGATLNLALSGPLLGVTLNLK